MERERQEVVGKMGACVMKIRDGMKWEECVGGKMEDRK